MRTTTALIPRRGCAALHPGEFIRAEILEPLDLTVTAAAQVLQVSRPALSNLLNGQADLSGDMALRIEKAFGVRMETLMRMQSLLRHRPDPPARQVDHGAAVSAAVRGIAGRRHRR